jgi:transcriptional regulator with XRE-family HTH domain
VVKASGNCFVNSKLPRPQETNPPDARIDFARQLKATRIARGFAYARHFAAALGLEENRYTRYERAEVEPSLSIIPRMCATLGVTPNDLLAPSEGAEPSASAAIGRQENLAWRLAS